MATTYTHRVILLIPASRRAAMVTWWNANMDAGQGAATWSVGLNATGSPSDPLTHYWTSAAMLPADLARLVVRLCNLAGIAQPANWQTMSRPEQLDWLAQNLPSIRANTGIAVVRDDNDGDWSRADDLLTALGLQRIRPS